MKILITGGFGYLGGRLAAFLASEINFEIVLGSRKSVDPPVWAPNAKVVKIDWDSSGCLEEICAGVDVIVHMAGMNAGDCGSDPVGAFQVNEVATARLLNDAVKLGVRRFIYLSTAHVYGSPLVGCISENTPPSESLHPYAASHLGGENVVRSAHQKGNIEGIVIRLSNSYGRPSHKEANCWMLLVNDLCRQAVSTKQMVLNSSGLQRRDFITISDACRAISHLLTLPTEKIDSGLFNVGGKWSPTCLQMAQKIAERVQVITGSQPAIRHQPANPNEQSIALNFEVGKLIDSGFTLNGNVSEEIDDLIRFCLIYWSESL